MSPMGHEGDTGSSLTGCVFCGAQKKPFTKEHIFPQWLSKFAGNEKIPAVINVMGKHVERRWSTFKLPACERCNNAFSELESRAREAFISISDGRIMHSHVITLFDWMDKVRVGHWHEVLRLSRESHNFVPKFNIFDRIAKSDRLLRVFWVPTKSKGIGLFGTNNPLYTRSPSVFGIVVKDIFILSVSNTMFAQLRSNIIEHYSGKISLDSGESEFIVRLKNDYEERWLDNFLTVREGCFWSFHGASKKRRYEFPFDTIFHNAFGSHKVLRRCDILEVPIKNSNIDAMKIRCSIEAIEIQFELLNDLVYTDASREFFSHLRGDYQIAEEIREAYYAMLNALSMLQYRKKFVPLRWGVGIR